MMGSENTRGDAARPIGFIAELPNANSACMIFSKQTEYANIGIYTAAAYAALQAEVGRLATCLAKSNEQAESYERLYYLTTDRAEAAEAKVAELISSGNELAGAMDMQEKRESGEFHIPAKTASHIWSAAKNSWARSSVTDNTNV